MEIPRDTVVQYLEQNVGGEQAQQAAAQLPDQVDHQDHADLLGQFGVDPQDLLGHVSDQGDGALAREAQSFLGGGE